MGTTTIGTPALNASLTLLKPRWVTNASQRASSSGWGTYASRRTCGGWGPKRPGSWSRPIATTWLSGSSASAVTIASSTPGVALKTVPRLASTVGRSGSRSTHSGSSVPGGIVLVWRRSGRWAGGARTPRPRRVA